MKLSTVFLAAAAALALTQSTFAADSTTAATPATRIISDTNVKAIEVKKGTSIKLCLVDDPSKKQSWQVSGWDGTAVDYFGGSAIDFYNVGGKASASNMNECPSGTTQAQEFRALEEGQSTIHLQHWDMDVPVGAEVPVLYWDIEVDVKP